MPDTQSVPAHIGYIVDGNRRWAKKHGLPPYEGHLAGYHTLRDVVLHTLELDGVEFVSIYIFSTENWKRPENEVGAIMKLAMRIFKSELKEYIKRGIRIRVLGIEDGLTDELIDAARKAEEATQDLSSGTLCICFNYGGQREIADAARRCVQDGLTPDEVTEQAIAERLYSPDVPACDLVVRTSGEQRLSNFMLWRSAYAELIFVEKFWPDMRTEDVTAIIEEYGTRQRRLGK